MILINFLHLWIVKSRLLCKSVPALIMSCCYSRADPWEAVCREEATLANRNSYKRLRLSIFAGVCLLGLHLAQRRAELSPCDRWDRSSSGTESRIWSGSILLWSTYRYRNIQDTFSMLEKRKYWQLKGHMRPRVNEQIPAISGSPSVQKLNGFPCMPMSIRTKELFSLLITGSRGV